MKVVSPNTSVNTIKLIPRTNTFLGVMFQMTNETTKEVINLNIPFFYYDKGIMTFDVTFDFNEGDKYGFKLYNDNDIYYRGKIFATAQQPQNYELSKDLYIYE